MKVTIKDIASEADVSVSTVSRVLNDKEDVSDKTRKKVLKIIKKLNYSPNSVARGLVMNKTNTIGLVIPDIKNDFFSEIARAVEEKAREYDYSVIFCNTDNYKKREKESIDLLKSKQVDGIIGSFSYNSYEEIITLKKGGFPVVQLDRLVKGTNVPSVSIDNVYSAYRATEYLIKNGHIKIAHIAGDSSINTGRARVRGFKKTLKENNIELIEECIVEGDYSRKSGYEAMKKIMNSGRKITAVFVANDFMAMGAYEAVFEKGFRIPEDISVVGHDNFNLVSLVKPGLTTMNQPKTEIGKTAASILIDIIEKDQKPENVHITMETSLIERESVKRII